MRGKFNVYEDAVETKIKSYIKILLCIFWYGSLIFWLLAIVEEL